MTKKLFIIFLISSLCSCGFRVIYKDRKDVEFPYLQELAAVRIKKDRNRMSQELKNNLYDLLNPEYLKVEPKYFLILTSTKSATSTYTTSTGSSGRNKVFLNVRYILENLENGAVISTGTTTVNDNYDVTSNRYGTYTADAYIVSNITKIAAQNIRNLLVNDLIEVRKKCAGEYQQDDKEEEVKEKFICPFDSVKTEEDNAPKKRSLPNQPLKHR